MKLRSLPPRTTGADAAGARGKIPRRGRTAAPLSFAQQRLWFLEQLLPGSPRFNIMTAVRLRGALSVALVRSSIDEIVRRHEVLRTVFRDQDGVPSQVVLPGLHVEVHVVDLAAIPSGRDQLIAALLAREARRAFDLAQAPLLRVLLIRSAAGDHVLVLGMHQIIVDRWSRGLFVQEVGALYHAFRGGTRPLLPELRIQYSDFALWQREQLQGEALAGLLSYWRRQLAPPLPNLDLPTDRPRPALQSWKGAMEYGVVPQAALERLKAIGLREGATLFALLLTLWNVLLYRYSGQSDVVVGSPVANRLHQDVEKLMGFFVNMLPLRLSLAGSESLRQLVARARETTLAALEHQGLPFEKLVDELQIERELSRHPLFQTTLTLQSSSLPPLDLPDLEMSLMAVDWGTTAYDLAIFFWETELWEGLEPGLSITLVYSRELFDRTTVLRMMAHWQLLVSRLAAQLEEPLASLSLLTAAEEHQALIEWNDERVEPLDSATLPGLFAAQARRTPARPAASLGGTSLTFRELNLRANQLARLFQRMGVRPEALVGLHLERSLEFVVAALAVLKAGGAYLPLDPGDPADRLAVLLADARPALIAGAPGLPGAALHPRRHDVHELLAAAAAESAEDPDLLGGGASLACVLYTSGSTGTPRGVAIPQRAVIRLALGNAGQLRPGDRVAHAANLGFDAATFEIWCTLLLGGEVVILGRDEILDLHARPDRLAAAGIDTLFLPTASFHQIAAAAPGSFGTLRALLVGGEVIAADAVRNVLRQGGPERFFHMYGPTESTTFATRQRIDEAPEGAVSIPIGRPVPGTEVYVLDADLQPVPRGAVGEIHLGGAGLARGYLRDPAATARRFLPMPFGDARGERLYRTGDLGSQQPNGEISFRGRFDRQVKIRGFRIELEEIESVLRTHPAVREAAVVTRRSAGGELLLAAYVAGRASRGEAVSGKALAAFARSRLPGYMVPAEVSVLDPLPRTASGKLDRRALALLPPAPAAAAAKGQAGLRPASITELSVALVWREVLGREVGIDEDFFEVGGHSLHATQVAARLRRQLGMDVPVRSLFELRTIGRLAAALAPAP